MSLTPKLWLGDATRDKSPSDPTGGKARTEFVPVNLRVNGQARTITVEPRTTLLDRLHRLKKRLTAHAGD